MISKPVKLVPIKSGHSSSTNRDYFEQIMIYSDDYPSALVHIDSFFYTRDSDNIYKKLENGETVECFMIFSTHEVI